MPLPDTDLIARLVEIGVMPTIAERIIADAAAAGQQLPTEAEMDDDAVVTQADIEQAAMFWMYTPDVPLEYKRLLHAQALDTAG